MDELILCVAPFPGEAQHEKFEGRLDVPDEVYRSFEEGASIAHLHVRDEQGRQTTDPTLFRREVERIHSLCPVIIEGSTGGAPEHSLEERSVSLAIPGIEMGSLNLGSVNMGGSVYRNPWPDIRFYARQLHARKVKPFLCVFDLSMFYNATRLQEKGSSLRHSFTTSSSMFRMPCPFCRNILKSSWTSCPKKPPGFSRVTATEAGGKIFEAPWSGEAM